MPKSKSWKNLCEVGKFWVNFLNFMSWNECSKWHELLRSHASRGRGWVHGWQTDRQKDRWMPQSDIILVATFTCGRGFREALRQQSQTVKVENCCLMWLSSHQMFFWNTEALGRVHCRLWSAKSWLIERKVLLMESRLSRQREAAPCTAQIPSSPPHSGILGLHR